jgi:RHS repeat-associated protein
MSEQPSLGAQSCRAKDAAAVGDPVHAGTGNVYHQEIDYRGRGPHLVRSYNSGLPGWSHNHMVRIIASASQADIVRPDGRIQTFAGTGDGAWNSNATVRASLVRLAAGGAARWLYVNDSDEVELYDAQGMPLSVTARNGQALTYQTDGKKVLSVTNAFGRRLAFAYDAQSRIVSATFADGQQAGYRYDGQGRLESVVFADGATRRYLYESAANPLLLTGVIDEAGSRFASWSYDAQGRAVSASQAGGADAAQLSYQSGATIVTDGAGAARTLRFASVAGKTVFAGQTAPCIRCSGDAASKLVDTSSGLVQETEDLLGVKTLFTWDPQRKLPLASTRAAGRPEAESVQIQWHPSLRLPALVTQAGRTTDYTYDDRGNRLSARTTDLATTRDKLESWTYNSLGQIQSYTNAAGQTWQFDYDATGNLVVERDALGQQVLHAYDANGRLTRTERPGGLALRYVYDARGRLIEEDRAGETTRFTYLQTGLLGSVTSADGYRVAYGYDAAQRLVSITDNRGVRIDYTLDAVGNRVREEVRGASGAIALLTSRTADPLGRIARIEGAAGQATSIVYDAIGRAESQTDPLNHSTRIEYDALGRVTGTQFADGARATQSWNALGHLTGVVDPKGVATGYAVDAFGDVEGETSPDIGALQYTRDAVGSPSEVRDAKGQLTRVARDALGRPTRISFADGTSSRFDYTAAGFLAQVSDPSGSTTFSRDVHGRVLAKTQVVNDSQSAPSTFALAYTLAPGGAIASLRYPSGLAVQYRRDATGRIIAIDAKAPGDSKRLSAPLVPLISDIAYTALGQPASWRWSNGDSAQRSFDADGRMTANDFATYAYDAGGRIRSLTQHLRARSNAGSKAVVYTVPLTWSVDYDSRNRITGFSRPGSEAHYTYDANGNRIMAAKRSIRDSDHDGGFESTDFARTEIQHANIDAASNRLLGLTVVKTVSTHGDDRAGDSSGRNIAYTLDANGAITSDGKRQFEYDAANRLSKLRLQSDGETVHIRYLHNALGQRVFKGEPVADQAIPDAATLGAGFVDWLKSRFGWMFSQSGAVTTLGTAYVWGDGDIPPWALLGEYDNGSAGGKGRTEYVWLPLEGGSAIPIAFFRGGRFYAVHTDHLGTPRLVTDDAKEPVWQWPYSAFGEVEPIGALRAGHSTEIATSVDLNLRFPGQYADLSAGSYSNFHRVYDPATGRYQQSDPLGLVAGSNRFVYVQGDTLGGVDPTGLREVDIYIWRAEGSSVGHVMMTEAHSTQVILSQFPANGMIWGPNSLKNFADTMAAEQRPPSEVWRVMVPNDVEFDRVVAQERAKSLWSWSPSNSSTQCTIAASRALKAGGVDINLITSGTLMPGFFGNNLKLRQGSGFVQIR